MISHNIHEYFSVLSSELWTISRHPSVSTEVFDVKRECAGYALCRMPRFLWKRQHCTGWVGSGHHLNKWVTLTAIASPRSFQNLIAMSPVLIAMIPRWLQCELVDSRQSNCETATVGSSRIKAVKPEVGLGKKGRRVKIEGQSSLSFPWDICITKK